MPFKLFSIFIILTVFIYSRKSKILHFRIKLHTVY
nr:MAG TPA: hypothetical protein [Caudoviricetes sp.]